MKTKKITTREIAKEAGVSMTAVSFALNGKNGISEETRDKILEVASRLGYKTTPAGKTINVALLFRNNMSHFMQMFYNELHNGIIDMSRSMPVSLMMASSSQTDDGVILSDNLRNGSVDGILVFGDQEQSVIEALRKLYVPFVVLDTSRRSEDVHSVFVDYGEASYRAASYLIGKGHRDIVYIGNNQESLQDFNILSFRGFQRAMEENNISLSVNRIQLDVTDEESLRRVVDRTIGGGKRPTALFCSADYYGVFVIRYLHELGIRVPQDISVIGVDDIVVSRYLVPSLTSVRIDRDEIGRNGLSMIRDLVEGRKVSNVKIREFEVIERESVANIMGR